MRKLLCILLSVVLVVGLNPGLTRQRAWADSVAPASIGDELSVQADETVTIGTGTMTATSGTMANYVGPYAPYFDSGASEQIYTSDEVGKSGTVTQVAFQTSTYASKQKSVKIYMGHTSQDEFTDSTLIAERDLTQVYDGSPTLAASVGWDAITLNTPFNYDSSKGNLVVAAVATGGYFTNPYYVHRVSGDANRAWICAKDSTNWASLTDGIDAKAYDTAKVQYFRPNIQLTFGDSGSAATTYTISKGTETNGSFTVSPESAAENDTITVTTTPNENYEVKSVTYTPEGGTATAATGSGNSYTFTMPAKNVTVNVEFEADSGGGSTSGADLEIGTKQQLFDFATAVNGGNHYEGKTVVLTADIDLGDEAWTPIGGGINTTMGSGGNYFSGTFDGQGHVVSGLRVTSSGGKQQGLFGAIYQATVRNLIVKGTVAVAVNGYSSAGISGVVGLALGACTIENVGNEAAVNNKDNGYVGGIVGQHIQPGSGSFESGTLRVVGCYNKGAISGDGSGVGGILGSEETSDCATIISSYNTGAIDGGTGWTSTGHAGILGNISDKSGNSEIYNSVNTGTITSEAGSKYGAISGDYLLNPTALNSEKGCYYLAGSSTKANGGSSTNAQYYSRTADELTTLHITLNSNGKSAGLFTEDAWKSGEGINDPVVPALAWEKAADDTPATYNITKAATTNGSFTVRASYSPDSAEVSTYDEVTDPAKLVYVYPVAAEGYEVDTVTATAATTGALTVTEGGSSYYYFKAIEEDIEVTVTFKAKAATEYAITVSGATADEETTGKWNADGGSFTVTHYADNGSGSTTQQNATTAPADDKIYIWPTPNENYVVDKVTYNDDTDHELTVAGSGASAYALFTMPAKAVTVTVTFKSTAGTTEPTLGLAITSAYTTYNFDASGNVVKTLDVGTEEHGWDLWVSISALLPDGSAPGQADVNGGKMKVQWFQKGSSGDTQVGADDTDVWQSATDPGSVKANHRVNVPFAKGTAEGTYTYYGKVTWEYNGTTYTATSKDFIATISNTYNVTIDSSVANGTVTPSSARAAVGDEVTLAVTPADGYELDTLTVTDEDGDSVTVTDKKFTMPAKSVTVAATFKSNGTSGDTFNKDADPAIITTQNDWDNFVKAVNGGTTFEGKTVKLATDDVTASKMAGWVQKNSNYVASTSSANKVFKGTFDGGKHAITLNITQTEESAGVGLFAGVYGADASNKAVIKNLRLTGSVTSKSDAKILFTGAAVGVGRNLQIIDVSSDATVLDEGGNAVNENGAVGGIIGSVAGNLVNYSKEESGSTDIIGCASRGTVTSNNGFAGGIVGSLKYWDASIRASYSTATVTAPSQSAGLVAGRAGNVSSTFDALYAVGSLNPVGDNALAPSQLYCTFVSDASTLALADLNANVQKSTDAAARAEAFVADPSDAKINNGMPVLQWEVTGASSFTVAFSTGDGGTAIDSQSVAAGGKATKPADPTRSGYVFGGWQLNGADYSFDAEVTGDITLTAVWTPDTTALEAAIATAKAELKKATDGTYATGESADKVDNGTHFVTPDQVTALTDAIAAAETAKAEATTAEAVATAQTTLTAAVQAFEKSYQDQVGTKGAKVTVTFDADGGTPAPEAVQVTSGEKVAKPATDPAKSGYVFKEWQLNDAAYDFDSSVTGDITLKAVYELDKAAYEAALASAQAELDKKGTDYVVNSAAASVPKDVHYATQEQVKALQDAIDLAKQNIEKATTPDNVKNVVDALTGATTTFTTAVAAQVGTAEEGETLTDNDNDTDATAVLDSTNTNTQVAAGESLKLEVVKESADDATNAELEAAKAAFQTELQGKDIAAAYKVDLKKVAADSTETTLNDSVGHMKLTLPVDAKYNGQQVQVLQLHESVSSPGTTTTHIYNPTVVDGKVTITLANELSQFLITVPQAATTHTVTFDSDGGSAITGSPFTVNDDGTVAQPANPTKSGYTFKEWQLNGATYEFSTPVTDDIVLKAVWTANATPTPTVTKKYMHRLYNPNSGEHFYTSNDAEYRNLVRVGWNDEGLGWYAPSTGDPVYRLYNPNEPLGDHHYTTSKAEYDQLCKIGWRGEGIGWYSADKSGVPLYRQYNPNAYPSGKTGAHNYTTSKGENDNLVKVGWKAEGIAWYGLK